MSDPSRDPWAAMYEYKSEPRISKPKLQRFVQNLGTRAEATIDPKVYFH